MDNVKFDSVQRWKAYGDVNGWKMPIKSRPWKRLYLIRHLRALYHSWQVSRWYSSGPGSVGIQTGYDQWVVVGILYGMDKDISEEAT